MMRPRCLTGIGPVVAALAFFVSSDMEANDRGKNRIDDALISQLVPSLKGARLMTLADLQEDAERADFQAEHFAFIVQGDFEGDGDQYYAIAGKYVNEARPSASTFILIVRERNGRYQRRFLTPVESKRLSLKLKPKCWKRRDGVRYQFTIASDHGAVLILDDGRYRSVAECMP